MQIPPTPFVKGGKNLYKILLILGIAACVAVVLLFWLYYQTPKNLEVDFFDVGQGDAILIKAPGGQNLLVDGGPDKTVIKRLAENLAWWDKRLDLVVLTHPHDDHVTGLIEVLRRYQVEKILMTGVLADSPSYQVFLQEIVDQGIKVEIINSPRIINLDDGVLFDIFFPDQNFNNKIVEK